MIYKLYKALAMLQIAGSAVLGLMFYDLTGMIAGFVAGVLIAGHFLTTLSTREINAENTKILKELLEEARKTQASLQKNLPQVSEKDKT